MTNRNRVPRLLFGALMIFFASGAAGSSVTKLNDDVFQPLRSSMLTKRIIIDRLPVYDDKRSTIELEEFQVWAPEGKIVIHGDYGKVLKTLAPPPMRFFRGLVNGDPESFAYFSMDPSGRNIQGLVVTRERRFSIVSVRRAAQKPGVRGRSEDTAAMDTFIQAFDDSDTLAEPPPKWECAVGDHEKIPTSGALHATGANGLPVVAHGISGTQAYAVRVDIETDFELYTNAGSNSTTLTNYVTNLSGAASTIYNRDLKTNITQGTVNIYTTSADPWSAANASAGLDEVADHYNGITLNGVPPAPTRTASNVVFLSGKNTGGGIAWVAVACGVNGTGNDFNQGNGHYGGPYAWCGGIGTGPGFAAVPDPNATQDGVVYGMPAYTFALTDGTQTYWPLAEYTHELGHNLGGTHTQCVVITDAERIAAGFTDGSTANFVDHCYGHDGGSCYSGTDYVAGSQSIYKGTIMSYCHNLFAGTGGVYPQSRFTFGQLVEPSHHELDDYMLRAAGPLAGGTNIVSAVGAFTISAITAPATVSPSSTGNTASITASPSAGATYAWTITNGTITGGATAATVTFTAGASGSVTLRATSYGTNHCGVTDTKSVVIGSTLAAPTNVIATATTSTNVLITWNAVVGATNGYQVERSVNGTTYTQVGTTVSGTTNFNHVVTANAAFLYRVRAVDAAMIASPPSIADLATSVIFTNALTVGTSVVNALDFTEIRTAVNAVQTLAGTSPTAYTDPTLNNTVTVKKVHVDEPLARLNAARTTLGLLTISLSGGPITAFSTPIRASDVNDIRAGVQ